MNEEKRYWSYIDWDGEMYDADFNSKQEAQSWADERYADYMCDDDEPMGYGDSFEADIELIEYYYDDDGERVITAREKSWVWWEYNRSDYDEHNTMWNVI